MAKGIWIEPSKDDPIYNGEFVLSSKKFNPESMQSTQSSQQGTDGQETSESIPLTEEEIRMLRGD